MFSSWRNVLWSIKSKSKLRLKARSNYCRNFSIDIEKLEGKILQNELFDREKKRQRDEIGRIEKIKVVYENNEDKVSLLMNKDLSTPHDCAKHISEGIAKLTALAKVDGVPWDMHRPLIGDCNIEFITMKSPDSKAVNNVFWRSCSFMLGAVIASAFKDDVKCHLHSFTSPNIKSGSFIYDVYLDLPNWEPTKAEMKVFSSIFSKLIHEEIPFERLIVDQHLALEMFKHNPYKSSQIPSIAQSNNDNKVILYRIKDHIDISKGPMVGNTNIIGRCTVTAIHKFKNESGESLCRFQGMALPSGILLNHYIYNILEERAKKLNEIQWTPSRLEI